jgi:hypothetical protein
MITRIKQHFPWWLRIAVKIVLARLPIPYRYWKRLRLFEHGDMNQQEKALSLFLEKARMAGVLNEESEFPYLGAGEDFGVLELGPGDSLFSAAIARSLSATRIWLVDAGTFATTDMKTYTRLFCYLRQRGFTLAFADEPKSVDDFLKECYCNYLTDGIQSLTCVPSSSINYIFSNAVLEHISRHEFVLMAQELFRILCPSGVCVHTVDLRDHLGGGLNSLRFSEPIWESRLFSSSGFYTNRIRFGEMLDIFTAAGFTYTLPRVLRWEALPTARSAMCDVYQKLPDEDLLVSVFDVVLRKTAGGVH